MGVTPGQPRIIGVTTEMLLEALSDFTPTSSLAAIATSGSASDLIIGTLANARLSPQVVRSDFSYPDPSWVTTLSASKLIGALDDARLSSNVPLKNAASNAFTGSVSLGGTLSMSTGANTFSTFMGGVGNYEGWQHFQTAGVTRLFLTTNGIAVQNNVRLLRNAGNVAEISDNANLSTRLRISGSTGQQLDLAGSDTVRLITNEVARLTVNSAGLATFANGIVTGNDPLGVGMYTVGIRNPNNGPLYIDSPGATGSISLRVNASYQAGLVIGSLANVQFRTGNWHGSIEDGLQRFLFTSTGTSYWRGHGPGIIHEWRDGNDAARMTLGAGGQLTLTGNRPIVMTPGTGVVTIQASAGGWANDLRFLGSSGTHLTGFGASGTNDTLAYAYIGTFAAPALIALGTGNVGIGTTTPAAKLEVASVNAGSSTRIGFRIDSVRSNVDTEPHLRLVRTGVAAWRISQPFINLTLHLDANEANPEFTFAQGAIFVADGQVKIGNTSGVRLKNSSGTLQARNDADTAFANIQGESVQVQSSGSTAKGLLLRNSGATSNNLGQLMIGHPGWHDGQLLMMHDNVVVANMSSTFFIIQKAAQLLAGAAVTGQVSIAGSNSISSGVFLSNTASTLGRTGRVLIGWPGNYDDQLLMYHGSTLFANISDSTVNFTRTVGVQNQSGTDTQIVNTNNGNNAINWSSTGAPGTRITALTDMRLAINYVDRVTLTNALFSVIPNATFSGHITSAFQSLSSDPTTLDIPSGLNRLVKNTTSGEIRWFLNDAGVIKKSPAYI